MLAAAMPATAPHIMRACHAAVSWCRALRRVQGGTQVGMAAVAAAAAVVAGAAAVMQQSIHAWLMSCLLAATAWQIVAAQTTLVSVHILKP